MNGYQICIEAKSMPLLGEVGAYSFEPPLRYYEKRKRMAQSWHQQWITRARHNESLVNVDNGTQKSTTELLKAVRNMEKFAKDRMAV